MFFTFDCVLHKNGVLKIVVQSRSGINLNYSFDFQILFTTQQYVYS